MPRVAIIGITHESSAFSLGLTGLDRFRVHRGAELEDWYDFPERLGAANDDVDWVPIMRAHGGAGANVDPAVFDALSGEILAGLAEHAPFDGVYFHGHGAMHVDGRDDAEETFLRAVRGIVGESTVISISMDPHGNLSKEFVELIDLACVHRHSPHVDHDLTSTRAITMLLDALRTGILPHKAWVRVPILLPGERSATVVEPGATVFGSVLPAIEKHGVLDAGIWVSYYWGDEPRNSGAAMAMSRDADAAAACAAELAATYWQHRNGFAITSEHSGSWAEALAFAETAEATPVWISDSGDNITGGATGDITYALQATLDSGFERGRILFAGLVDADALDRAIALGAGATLEGPLGAWLDARFAAPVTVPWTILGFIEGAHGEGIAAALLEHGSIHVTVQRVRAVFATPDDIAFVPRKIIGQAFVPVEDYAAVVVKNGYLFPSQEERAAVHFMALTPGGTDLDEERIQHHRLSRPLHPFDKDFEPDLTVHVIPARTAASA